MKRILASLLLLVLSTAFADPAYWYRWESKMSARRVCMQTLPGEGWVKVSGPYRDSQCRWPISEPPQSK